MKIDKFELQKQRKEEIKKTKKIINEKNKELVKLEKLI